MKPHAFAGWPGAFLRPQINNDAGDAPARTPARGIGRRSVYDGPRKILGGAPVLKQNKPA
jgi:hypothetical protein